MTWRKHPTHAAETAAVKAALRAAGILFRSVGHGQGTAWAWLEINLGPGAPLYLQRAVYDIARAVTGRSGPYDGQTLVFAQ